MKKQVQKYKAKLTGPAHECGIHINLSDPVEIQYYEIDFTNLSDFPLKNIKVKSDIPASELSGDIPKILPVGASFTNSLIIFTNNENREDKIKGMIHVDAKKGCNQQDKNIKCNE